MVDSRRSITDRIWKNCPPFFCMQTLKSTACEYTLPHFSLSTYSKKNFSFSLPIIFSSLSSHPLNILHYSLTHSFARSRAPRGHSGSRRAHALRATPPVPAPPPSPSPPASASLPPSAPAAASSGAVGTEGGGCRQRHRAARLVARMAALSGSAVGADGGGYGQQHYAVRRRADLPWLASAAVDGSLPLPRAAPAGSASSRPPTTRRRRRLGAAPPAPYA